jgi:hypothetical protein
MTSYIKFRSFQVIRIQIQSNLAQICSLNSNSNFISNFRKLQWENLFLIQFPTRTYSIWIFLSISNLNPFGKFLIKERKIIYCCSGPAHPSASPAPLSCDAKVTSPLTTPAMPLTTHMLMDLLYSKLLLSINPCCSFIKSLLIFFVLKNAHLWFVGSSWTPRPVENR